MVVADGTRTTVPKPPQPPGVTHWNESMVIADGDPAPPFPRPPLIVSSGPHQLSQVADGNVNYLGLAISLYLLDS